MSVAIKNSHELIDPAKLKLKILVYGLAGVGKTSFLASAAGAGKLGVAACEPGYGHGLLTVASRGIDYCEPNTYQEFDQICSGLIFKDHDVVGLDSLSYMTRSFIKDYALSMPRSRGATDKRKAGVPELDDYGVMGECTRRLLNKLIDQDKHVVVTALLRIDKPDMETGGGELLIGPDLPGQLFLASTAMFDTVMCLKTRSKLRDPKDPKSRYTERYLVTEQQGPTLAKCRLVGPDGKSLLAPEEVFDPATGQGTFSALLDKIQRGYAASAKAA